MGLNKTIIDSSMAQYAFWEAFVEHITPNPKISKGAYRPSAWALAGVPNTYIEDDSGVFWYFDAIIRLEHTQIQQITQHPVQTGANITDHSFSLPAQLMLEIGMSDIMDSVEPGQWGTGEYGTPKSVVAYQKILEWKNAGEPLTITTRLDTYENMVVGHLTTLDNINTIYGLKSLVTFQQIITVEIKVEASSLRPSVTDKNDVGVQELAPVNKSVMDSVLGPRVKTGVAEIWQFLTGGAPK